MIVLILIIAGIVLTALQAFNVPSSRVSLGWLGLSLWGVAYLIASRGLA